MRVDNFKNQEVQGTQKTIHIVHILDSSGSMGYGNSSKWNAAVQGIQQELTELKKDNNINYLFSLVVFGEVSKKVEWKQNIQNVTYTGSWRAECGTALYDTMFDTLSDLQNISDSVVVKIFTDGQDNWSKVSTSKVQELIKKLEQKNFTITFVGTESDVKYIKSNLGIAEGNTLVHDNTPESVERSFRKSIAATQNYASSVNLGEFTKTFSFYQ